MRTKFLALLAVGVMASLPAWAGRVSTSASGRGDYIDTCTSTTGSSSGTPFVSVTFTKVTVANCNVDADNNGSLGPPSTLFDLFALSLSPGDIVTLKVNDPSKNWGVFEFDGTGTTSPPIAFTTATDEANLAVLLDFSNGTTWQFGNSPDSQGNCSDAVGGPECVIFYTDPGALQFLSLNGVIVAGSEVPEPGSLILLGSGLLVAGRQIRRRLAGR